MTTPAELKALIAKLTELRREWNEGVAPSMNKIWPALTGDLADMVPTFNNLSVPMNTLAAMLRTRYDAAVAQVPPLVNPPSADWLVRSTAPGVTLATDFRTDEEVLPYRNANASGTTAAEVNAILAEKMQWVQRAVDNGVPCLKIISPASKKDAAGKLISETHSQAWVRRFKSPTEWPNDSDGFGTTPFYVQFAVKIPGSRLLSPLSGLMTWKILTVANLSLSNPFGARAQSSNNRSLVVTNGIKANTQFPNVYLHTDQETNGHSFSVTRPGMVPGSNLDLLPGWDRGAAFPVDERYCTYLRPDLGCPMWTPDVWAWFMLLVHTPSIGGTEGNRFDLWRRLDGEKKWTTIASQRNIPISGKETSWQNGYNAGWLSNYLTGGVTRDTETYMLVREYVVSTQEPRIAGVEPVNVALQADPPKFALIVDGGTGSGSYAAGTVVAIRATPVSGQLFEKWEGLNVLDPTSASTTLAMPPGNGRVFVKYRSPVVVDPPGAYPIVNGAIEIARDGNDEAPNSWWASFPLNQNVKVLGTAPLAGFAPLIQPFFNHRGASLTSGFSAWEGSAYDPVGRRQWFHLGGHSDSNFNGMPEFNWNTLRWRLPLQPSDYTEQEITEAIANYTAAGVSWGTGRNPIGWNQGYMPGGSTWKDGKPTASHVYNSIVWASDIAKVIHGRPAIHLTDPLTGETSSENILSFMSDSSCVYDPVTHKYYIFFPEAGDYFGYRIYQPITKVLSARMASGGVSQCMHSLIVDSRRILCYQDDEQNLLNKNAGPQVRTINLDTGAVTPISLVNHPIRPLVSPGIYRSHSTKGASAYSPTLNRVYVAQRRGLSQNGNGAGEWGRFTVINPANWECSEYQPTGTPIPENGQTSGEPYSKMIIIERSNGIFIAMFNLATDDAVVCRIA